LFAGVSGNSYLVVAIKEKVIVGDQQKVDANWCWHYYIWANLRKWWTVRVCMTATIGNYPATALTPSQPLNRGIDKIC